MKVFKKTENYIVELITCDKCGLISQTDSSEYYEFFSIEKRCGTSSIFGDRTKLSVDYCQHCFKELNGSYVKLNSQPNPSWESFFLTSYAEDIRRQNVIDSENESIAELLEQLDRDTMSEPIQPDFLPCKVLISANLLHQLTVVLPTDVISALDISKGDVVEFFTDGAIVTFHKSN